MKTIKNKILVTTALCFMTFISCQNGVDKKATDTQKQKSAVNDSLAKKLKSKRLISVELKKNKYNK